VHLDIIKVFYSPTDAQEKFLKNNIKIYIKTAPTCFGAVTPSSGSELFVLANVKGKGKVTLFYRPGVAQGVGTVIAVLLHDLGTRRE
jgi:hypothetical protein